MLKVTSLGRGYSPGGGRKLECVALRVVPSNVGASLCVIMAWTVPLGTGLSERRFLVGRILGGASARVKSGLTKSLMAPIAYNELRASLQ